MMSTITLGGTDLRIEKNGFGHEFLFLICTCPSIFDGLKDSSHPSKKRLNLILYRSLRLAAPQQPRGCRAPGSKLFVASRLNAAAGQSFFDAVVARRPDIRAAKPENQNHVRRPRPYSLDGREHVHDLGVGKTADALRGKRPLKIEF